MQMDEAMEYIKPEMVIIRFEQGDVLTNSYELPIIPANEDGSADL